MMSRDDLNEMDKLRAQTDIVSQCGDGSKEGSPNPIIPQGGSCDVNEPVDPKKAPQAQGTPIANTDDEFTKEGLGKNE